MKNLKAMVLLFLLLLQGCSGSGAAIPRVEDEIPPGFVRKEEHFDPDGFQDYTNYCKYWYPSAEPFERDGRWHEVSEEEIREIRGYFENFRGWMELAGRLDEYDFDPAFIGAGDQVRLETGSKHWSQYDDYTLYFFDAETGVLYYIHSNI